MTTSVMTATTYLNATGMGATAVIMKTTTGINIVKNVNAYNCAHTLYLSVTGIVTTSTMCKHVTGTGETAATMTVLAGIVIVPTASAWIQKNTKESVHTLHGGVMAIVKMTEIFKDVIGTEEIAATMTVLAGIIFVFSASA